MHSLVKFLIPILLVLLSACSSAPKMTTPKLEQKGALKAHPGLLGQPVPPELREAEERKVARVDATGAQENPSGAEQPANATSPRETAKTSGAQEKTKNDTLPSSPGSLYFDYKDARIRPDHERLLEEHARKLTASRKAKLRIEGHADERGSDNYNKQLGMKRAESVKQALTQRGVAPKQLKLLSLGKSRPKVKGHDEASWAENRRADLIYERE